METRAAGRLHHTLSCFHMEMKLPAATSASLIKKVFASRVADVARVETARAARRIDISVLL